MSRIGKKPIPIPDGVTATVDGQTVTAKGPKGELSFVVHDECTIEMSDDGLSVMPRSNSRAARSLWGMSRTMVGNIVTGVASGFERKLEINGVGYRAQVQGNSLQLALGYSHDISFAIPDGISVQCPKPTEVVISGIDKQKVGQIAAKVRELRPPEPYKGKGVKYSGEYIFRKEGKKK